MPYKNKDDTRNRARVAAKERYRRRMTGAKALLGGKCVRCGTTNNLEFDHVDPATKIFEISQGATGRNETDFWLEVAKCQLLCSQHHWEKSNSEGSTAVNVGENHYCAKLRELDVKYIRGLSELGHSNAAIAREFGVRTELVRRVVNGVTWKQVV